MFVQFVIGRPTDPEAPRREWDVWRQELAPGATGWLGSTGGMTADGRFVALDRWESEEFARRAEARPEHKEWYERSRREFEDVHTAETSDADLFLGGGSDRAKFVQLMRGRTTDRDRLRDTMLTFERDLPKERPEVLGGYIAWEEPDRFIEVVYFSSEQEARAGESKSYGADLQGAFDEFGRLAEDVEYIDVPDPWLASP